MVLSCSGFMARDRCQQRQLEESSQRCRMKPSDSAAPTLALGFGSNPNREPDLARITWPWLGLAWVLPPDLNRPFILQLRLFLAFGSDVEI